MVAVGTVLVDGPSTNPSVRDYPTGLLPQVLTASQSAGKGCITRTCGRHRVASRCVRTQSIRPRWLRRPSARCQWPDQQENGSRHCIGVARDRVVREVTSHHAGQPPSLLRDGLMPARLELVV
jgi:hypothetical protein